MKAASISDIKKELKGKSALQLTELVLRLARAKKENKELLTYLLFEADDEEAYKNGVKAEMSESINTVHTSNPYFAKKSLRKVLRNTAKAIKFSDHKTTEAELLIHFCEAVKASDIPMRKSTALQKIYDAQIKKIKAAVATLHEDLQYEYNRQIETLERN